MTNPENCPRCGAPKYPAAPQCHLCYGNDIVKLGCALNTALTAPHPTWCKIRQGKGCTCYKADIRNALKELEGL
jgi:hypothetical protein